MIQMRRKDREMSSEFALEVVDKCEYAVLSMTDLQNEPYAVPLSIVRIGSCIYFHGGKAGKKSEILATNPQVCLVCVGNVKPLEDKFTTEYESAMVFGKISEVSDKEEKTEALRALCMRYTPKHIDHFDSELERSFSVTGVWKIQIDEITGKCKKKK